MININTRFSLDLVKLRLLNKTDQILSLVDINSELDLLTAEQRVNWAFDYLPERIVLSSSFGIQSVVTLHLIITKFPDIPVIFIDTGYLFPETYLFVDKLTDLFNINLQVFRSKESAAWQEARYGKLWEQGLKGIEKYNFINKIEPMNNAIDVLNVKTWLSGLRRDQSFSRKHLPVLSIQRNVFKFLPIVDWDNSKIQKYIEEFKLISHPLSKKGYVSIGDVHTTSKLEAGLREEDTRFFGIKRECGLHID